MELTTFLAYLRYRECVQIDTRRVHFIFKGPENGKVVFVPRNAEHLERENIYLICMDLGIDMPEKFKPYQDQMDKIWPNRKAH